MAFWTKDDEQPETTAKPAANGSALADPGVLTRSAPVASKGSSSVGENPKDLEERFGKLRSALGPGTIIQGKLSFDTPVRIDGKLSGEIFSSRELIVGDQGEIDAVVEVASLIVQGSVKGNIKATERIELWAGGSIDGDIETPVFVMEETARFTGNCKMGRAQSTSPSVSKEKSSGKGKGQDAKNRASGSEKVASGEAGASVH